MALGDLVKSTLGPKVSQPKTASRRHANRDLGDEQDPTYALVPTPLQQADPVMTESASNQTITVTNDGATILKSIALDNPAAKILVNISKVQDDEVGDGTTSVCVLASELLREAEKLVTTQRIHPQTVVEGYRIASKAALKALEESALDNGKDEKKFRDDLFNIARTTLSSKVLSQDKDYFANLAVDAVLRLRGSTDLEHIQIIKKAGGKLTDSYLDEGGLQV
jgi:T-complex protein 1 subunit beta